MGKRRSGYLQVEVDLDEALSACTDKMILEEVDERKLSKCAQAYFDPDVELLNIREELLRGRPAEALAILDRMMLPKWRSQKACETALMVARK